MDGTSKPLSENPHLHYEHDHKLIHQQTEH